MSRNASQLRMEISDFDAVRPYAMTGGEELARALWAACELIEDLQQRVAELEGQTDDDALDLAAGAADDDGMPRYADPADEWEDDEDTD